LPRELKNFALSKKSLELSLLVRSKENPKLFKEDTKKEGKQLKKKKFPKRAFPRRRK